MARTSGCSSGALDEAASTGRSVTSAAVPTNNGSNRERSAPAARRVRRVAARAAARAGRPFERWFERRVGAVLERELAETRAELHTDLATLVELTIELQRIAASLEAAGEHPSHEHE